MKPQRGRLTSTDLGRTEVLVISNALARENENDWTLPTPSAFDSAEIATVRSWVEDGGSLLLIADHMHFPGAARSLAAEFGILMGNGFALDAETENGRMRFTRSDSSLADHPITRGRKVLREPPWQYPKMKTTALVIAGVLISMNVSSQSIVKEYQIQKKYLNLPVDMQQDRQLVHFLSAKDTITYSVIRIADGDPDYWVFKDVSAWKGKQLKLVFSKHVQGIELIRQSDRFAGQDSLYQETNRPQFHFSSRRGWNNDPKGLVYLDGEYHLYYQHNPYEVQWENMHWGHAVSPDLIHWTELNDALSPDHLGTIFSGSAVVDRHNTAGWGQNALVAAYTADKGEGERSSASLTATTREEHSPNTKATRWWAKHGIPK